MKYYLELLQVKADRTNYKVYDNLLVPEKKTLVAFDVEDAWADTVVEGDHEEIVMTPAGLAQICNQLQEAYDHGEAEYKRKLMK